jgi:hypothetical protein
MMQYGNGDKFDGEFRADLRHGTGTMTFALGAIAAMEGDWHEGSMLRGTVRYRNGDEYQGPLKNSVPHGAGAQLVMPNGCKFKGTWSEGRISPGSKLIVHLPDELEPLMGTVSTDASLLINTDTFGEWDVPCLLPAPLFLPFAEDREERQ